jgi:hypothetical protein
MRLRLPRLSRFLPVFYQIEGVHATEPGGLVITNAGIEARKHADGSSGAGARSAAATASRTCQKERQGHDREGHIPLALLCPLSQKHERKAEEAGESDDACRAPEAIGGGRLDYLRSDRLAATGNWVRRHDTRLRVGPDGHIVKDAIGARAARVATGSRE